MLQNDTSILPLPTIIIIDNVTSIRQIYDIRDNNLRQLTWKTEIYDVI